MNLLPPRLTPRRYAFHTLAYNKAYWLRWELVVIWLPAMVLAERLAALTQQPLAVHTWLLVQVNALCTWMFVGVQLFYIFALRGHYRLKRQLPPALRTCLVLAALRGLELEGAQRWGWWEHPMWIVHDPRTQTQVCLLRKRRHYAVYWIQASGDTGHTPWASAEEVVGFIERFMEDTL